MTKIDIISGFLGAGKTTFIKKLLEEAIAREQVVLIENEFGEIGIDGGFLKDAGVEIREMNSGCICCSLAGDWYERYLSDVNLSEVRMRKLEKVYLPELLEVKMQMQKRKRAAYQEAMLDMLEPEKK